MLPLRLLLAILVASMTSPALAQDRVGTAVRVINHVTADNSSIATGDGVAQNQIIEVAPESLGELQLNDDTRLALGPGSRLVLDKLVYDAANTSSDVAVSLVKGAFRIVTGVADRRDYRISTPSAVISVRDTVFDLYIAPNGAEWLLLHKGSIEVCNVRGRCHVIDNPCNVMRLSPGGVLGEPGAFPTRFGVEEIEFQQAFPFVNNPPFVDFVVYHTRPQIEENQCGPPVIRRSREQTAEIAPSVPVPEVVSPPPAAPSSPVATANDQDPGGQHDKPASSEVETGTIPEGTTETPAAATPAETPDAVTRAAATPPAAAHESETATDDATETADAIEWTGWHIGILVGRGWGDQQSLDFNCPCNDDVFQRYAVNQDGWMGGVQLGYDWRNGMIEFGIEADFSLADMDADLNPEKGGTSFIGSSEASQDLNSFATLRGRAGVVMGDILIFATAGLAGGDVDYSYRLDDPQGVYNAQASHGGTAIGWTAGGGIEIPFGLLSLRAEYLYYDLGSERLTAGVTARDPGTGEVSNTGGVLRPEFETNGQIVRTGINVRLN